MTVNRIIRNGMIVTPSGTFVGDVAISGETIAAVTTRMEIARTLTQKVHFNTYGGNAVSMAAGNAVLDVIEEDGLQQNCLVLGKRFMDGLEKLQSVMH